MALSVPLRAMFASHFFIETVGWARLLSGARFSSAPQRGAESERQGLLSHLQQLMPQFLDLWAATVRTIRDHPVLSAVQHYRDCPASV